MIHCTQLVNLPPIHYFGMFTVSSGWLVQKYRNSLTDENKTICIELHERTNISKRHLTVRGLAAIGLKLFTGLFMSKNVERFIVIATSFMSDRFTSTVKPHMYIWMILYPDILNSFM
jgi:hypothetical protein